MITPEAVSRSILVHFTRGLNQRVATLPARANHVSKSNFRNFWRGNLQSTKWQFGRQNPLPARDASRPIELLPSSFFSLFFLLPFPLPPLLSSLSPLLLDRAGSDPHSGWRTGGRSRAAVSGGRRDAGGGCRCRLFVDAVTIWALRGLQESTREARRGRGEGRPPGGAAPSFGRMEYICGLKTHKSSRK